MRYIDFNRSKCVNDNSESPAHTGDAPARNLSATGALTRNGETMTLIPWEDIWTSLRVAHIRGHGEMIDVFYDTLFKEAVFDDDGAWSSDPKARY